MQRSWLWVAMGPVLAVGLLSGIACGGGDDDDAENTPAAAATKPASSGATTAATTSGGDKITEVPAGAPMVDQDNLTFKPETLKAKVNEKIYFKNSETAIHTVTIDSKNVSGNMRKGDIVTWTAPKAGTYKVTCDYHPQMKATITVE